MWRQQGFQLTTTTYTGLAIMPKSKNIVCVGYTGGAAKASMEFLVTAYSSSSGKVLWTNTLGGGDMDKAYDVTIDKDDNIYLTGRCDEGFLGASVKLCVISYTKKGILRSTLNIDSTNNSVVESTTLAVDTDHSVVYSLGNAMKLANDGAIYTIPTIAKFDSATALALAHWDFVVESGFQTQILASSLTMDGDLLICGQTDTAIFYDQYALGGIDYWLMLISRSGDISWLAREGDTGKDICTGIVSSINGDIFSVGVSDSNRITGSTTHGLGYDDVVLYRHSKEGVLRSSIRSGGESVDHASAIALDDNSVYISGTSRSSSFNDVLMTKRAVQSYGFVAIYDYTGNFLQVLTTGNSGNIHFHDIAVYRSSIYIAGDSTASSYEQPQQGDKDAIFYAFTLAKRRNHDDVLSGGAIAGIVISVVCGFGFFVGCVFCFCLRSNSNNNIFAGF